MPELCERNNKRIAKNTFYLYCRMLLTMVVSLYTSRVVLNVLGVDDFGIYQTVGGIVALFAYAKNALSVGTSRFLTYELGRGDVEKLKRTFSTSLSIHIILSVIIVLLSETVGLWYILNKLNVAFDRFDAAVFAYHISVLTVFITVTQIPYNSSIISHEKMKVFAYVSLIEVFLKLAIVYCLTISSFDKLKFYAVLLLIIQLLITFFYRFYCKKNFVECRYDIHMSKKIFKDILSYSSWNFMATGALALCNQGIIVLLNLFFSPAIVAAKAVANQVNSVANQFVENFRVAIEPQVVKQFAVGNKNESRILLLESTKYSFYITLLLVLPIYMVAKPLIELWLGFIPEFAPEFLQLALITSLIEVFNRSFYTPLYAKGDIRANSVVFALLLCVSFCTVFILFKMGFSPLYSAYVILVAQIIMSFVVKPYLLVKITNYPIRSILSVLYICLKVSFVAAVIPMLVYFNINKFECDFLTSFVLQVCVTLCSVCMTIWYVGLDEIVKRKIINYVLNKIKKIV